MDALKQLYHSEIAHNAGVDEHLARIDSILQQADSSAALEAALRAQEPTGSLVYKNRFFWILLLVCLALCLPAYWLVTLLVANTGLAWINWLGLALGAGLLFYVASFYRGSTACDAMLARALTRQEELQYGFRYGQSQNGHSHDSILADFAHAFKRGNHSNEIPRFASGQYRHAGAGVEYTVFNYHYVNRRTETYYENGRRKQRQVFDHFDRWGLFVSGVQPLGVAISSGPNRVFPVRWDTSSIAFNRRHHITGVSEVELARLFQPVNVLLIEALLSGHREFELQFSDRLPVLYWGFNLDPFKRSLPPGKPQNFGELAALLPGLKLVQFEQLLQTLQPLLEKMVK
ncbi:MAG: hypothetical protein GX665_01550 [Gammaproteobacteria bacterium]|nr:hypothetical protein [Gammaproteobacteria bacterium]